MANHGDSSLLSRTSADIDNTLELLTAIDGRGALQLPSSISLSERIFGSGGSTSSGPNNAGDDSAVSNPYFDLSLVNDLQMVFQTYTRLHIGKMVDLYKRKDHKCGSTVPCVCRFIDRFGVRRFRKFLDAPDVFDLISQVKHDSHRSGLGSSLIPPAVVNIAGGTASNGVPTEFSEVSVPEAQRSWFQSAKAAVANGVTSTVDFFRGISSAASSIDEASTRMRLFVDYLEARTKSPIDLGIQAQVSDYSCLFAVGFLSSGDEACFRQILSVLFLGKDRLKVVQAVDALIGILNNGFAITKGHKTRAWRPSAISNIVSVIDSLSQVEITRAGMYITGIIMGDLFFGGEDMPESFRARLPTFFGRPAVSVPRIVGLGGPPLADQIQFQSGGVQVPSAGGIQAPVAESGPEQNYASSSDDEPGATQVSNVPYVPLNQKARKSGRELLLEYMNYAPKGKSWADMMDEEDELGPEGNFGVPPEIQPSQSCIVQFWCVLMNDKKELLKQTVIGKGFVNRGKIFTLFHVVENSTHFEVCDTRFELSILKISHFLPFKIGKRMDGICSYHWQKPMNGTRRMIPSQFLPGRGYQLKTLLFDSHLSVADTTVNTIQDSDDPAILFVSSSTKPGDSGSLVYGIEKGVIIQYGIHWGASDSRNIVICPKWNSFFDIGIITKPAKKLRAPAQSVKDGNTSQVITTESTNSSPSTSSL